jgi:hypothetical protein
MMAEPKPFASLSSGLLARKGTAKPAMRPQGFGQMGVSMEDLGWNDMGQSQPSLPTHQQEMPEHVPSSIAALTPAPRLQTEPAPAPHPAPPPVVEQQRAIESTFAPKPAPAAVKSPKAIRPASAAAQPQSRASAGKAKAAFTLRLEAERHLKLRLACALTNRSAQQIVTEALDGFLETIPELDAFASRVPAASGKKN